MTALDQMGNVQRARDASEAVDSLAAATAAAVPPDAHPGRLMIDLHGREITPEVRREWYWLTALHEAGHAWAFWALLGIEIDLVSIRRQGGAKRLSGGVTIPGHIEPLRLEGHPLDGCDPAERRRADQMLVMNLIGDAAERALGSLAPIGGFGSMAFDEPAPEMPAPVPETVAPALERVLVATEAGPTPRGHSDDELAAELAERLVGSESAGAYLRWARLEAYLAARGRGARPIHALASRLWREPVLDGRTVAEIIDAHGGDIRA